MAKKAATIKAATKGEVYTKLAAKTGLTKKQVSTVFEALDRDDRQRAGQEGPRLVPGPGLAQAEGRAQAGHQGQDRESTPSPKSR